MLMLSPHFSAAECKCQCARHKNGDYCFVSPRLLSLAEKVRDIVGAMHVNSCCRCAEHNAEVGGVPGSKHVGTAKRAARAMDFRPLHCSVAEAHALLLRAYEAGHLPELGGLGLYDTFLHIDTARAADGHLRRWDYRSRKG